MLAARLKELFDSKELRVAMGKKSREFAERDFSVENVVKTHLDIYKKIG
jgi:glycosyltransferase involved in cell wall biosynthesis